MKRKSFLGKHSGFISLFFACLLLQFPPPALFAQLIVSEVMFDPIANDNYYEFVEIWNASDAVVNLSGWRLGDGTGDDAITAVDSGIMLNPNQFGLILDPDYFVQEHLYEELIGDGCLIMTVESTTLGSRGLRNSEPETIELFNPSGAVVAAYTYSVGNTPGYSDEKIHLLGGDDQSNWSDCLSLNGTPGFKNSVSPDSLNLTMVSLTAFPLNPKSGTALTLTASVVNTGLVSIVDFSVGFFLDLDGDSSFSGEEMFDSVAGGFLSPGAEVEITTMTEPLAEGVFLFGSETLMEDENPEDDTACLLLNVGALEGSVVFNEVMQKPLPGTGEWVELFNRSDSEVSLAGWSFSDSDSSNPRSIETIILFPDAYLVLAEDSTIFDYYLPVDVVVMVMPEWPILNNNGDTLYLLDAIGAVMDELVYPPDWGNVAGGISMERVNPFSPVSNLSNWFPCVDAQGASPGRRNSVYFLPSMQHGIQLAVEPEVFFPESSEGDNCAVIKFKLPFPAARINLRVFDVRGRIIKFLARGVMTGSDAEFIWDGRDDSGGIARIGPYIIHLEAISEAFAESNEAKAVVILGRKL